MNRLSRSEPLKRTGSWGTPKSESISERLDFSESTLLPKLDSTASQQDEANITSHLINKSFFVLFLWYLILSICQILPSKCPLSYFTESAQFGTHSMYWIGIYRLHVGVFFFIMSYLSIDLKLLRAFAISVFFFNCFITPTVAIVMQPTYSFLRLSPFVIDFLFGLWFAFISVPPHPFHSLDSL